MNKNVGQADRILRIVAAVVIGWLYFSNAVSGLPLAIIAVVLIGTSAIGFCPLYRVLRISTLSPGLRKKGAA